eukprot:jgi/Ulvmu1/11967/UM082_0046.1
MVDQAARTRQISSESHPACHSTTLQADRPYISAPVVFMASALTALREWICNDILTDKAPQTDALDDVDPKAVHFVRYLCATIEGGVEEGKPVLHRLGKYQDAIEDGPDEWRGHVPCGLLQEGEHVHVDGW